MAQMDLRFVLTWPLQQLCAIDMILELITHTHTHTYTHPYITHTHIAKAAKKSISIAVFSQPLALFKHLELMYNFQCCKQPKMHTQFKQSNGYIFKFHSLTRLACAPIQCSSTKLQLTAPNCVSPEIYIYVVYITFFLITRKNYSQICRS